EEHQTSVRLSQKLASVWRREADVPRKRANRTTAPRASEEAAGERARRAIGGNMPVKLFEQRIAV
ncbi:hypothetical protein J6590_032588, partial [Homalodisca vitripennis]